MQNRTPIASYGLLEEPQPSRFKYAPLQIFVICFYQQSMSNKVGSAGRGVHPDLLTTVMRACEEAKDWQTALQLCYFRQELLEDDSDTDSIAFERSMRACCVHKLDDGMPIKQARHTVEGGTQVMCAPCKCGQSILTYIIFCRAGGCRRVGR